MGEAVLIAPAALAVAIAAAPRLLLQVPPEPPPEPPAATVVAVELRSDAPLAEPDQVRRLIEIAPGEPLRQEEVRRLIRVLYASGTFAGVDVNVRPAPGGVVLVVALWANVIVESIGFEGELGLEVTELRPMVEQGQGLPLVEDRLIRGVYRLEELYRSSGFWEASVRLRVATDEERQTARVVYEIASGPRATIGAVEFRGDIAPFTADQLRERLRVGPGERYRQEAVREDVERLRSWLLQQGHRMAEVDEPQEDYRSESDQVNLAYPVEVGPAIEVPVVGAELSQLEKQGLLPFLGPEGYDEALVLQAADRIRTEYQEQGHYRVEVEWDEERIDGLLRLTLSIEPGPVYTVEELRFTGHEAVSDGSLRELMATGPRRLLLPGSGRLVSEVLEDDLDNIRSYLALHGYLDAEVGPPDIDLGNGGSEGRIAITIPIEAGEQRRLLDLRFEGVDHLDLDELRGQLPLAAGGAFHPQLLAETLEVMRARYEEMGYAGAQVSASEEWNADRTLVEVTIRVLEGPQRLVDHVIIRGNQETVTEVIRRSIDLTAGEPLSTRRLLEVQRDLYGLGIFSRVQVELAPAPPGAAARDVVIRVEEGKSQRVQYGVGYDSEDEVRGLLGYSHGNLLGRALTFQVTGRASQREQQYRALVRQPYLGPWPLPVTYSLFRLEQEQTSFDIRQWGTQVEALRITGHEDVRWSLLYTYKIAEVDLAADFDRIQVPREFREVQISSLSPGLLLDERDDPLNPSRGWSTNLQFEYAFPLLSAAEEFSKFFVQQTAFLPLGEWGVVAGSARFGGIEPLEGDEDVDPTVPAGFPSRFIPPSERFFGGGRSTHRAFERDDLGVRGESLVFVPDPEDAGDGEFLPVGGNGLFLVNLDYRFPIAGAFGGTVFFDTGNIWGDWQDIDLGDLRHGVGVGARYLSPIGPLRLDLGYKLERLEDEDPYVVFLSFGNPF